LLAILLEAKATLIDQALDLHDRMIGALFNRAKRRHAEEFQQSGEAIHEKVRLYWRIGEALLQARQSGIDPFPAIEAIIPWEAFVQSVTEAQRLARVEGFDYLHRISEGYTQIRRYAPDFLNAFRFKAAPAAQPILEAIETLKTMDTDGLRKVPADSPTDFIRKRWKALVFTDSGLDRRFYELCALSELKNALRSGDIWVQGSRQFKDFDEYLIPSERFSVLREANRLSLAVATDCEAYLNDRLGRLDRQLEQSIVLRTRVNCRT
jgi:Transposase.